MMKSSGGDDDGRTLSIDQDIGHKRRIKKYHSHSLGTSHRAQKSEILKLLRKQRMNSSR